MDAADGGAHVSCEMKMLANNRMETLLPVSIRNVDNVCAYYYDVTSRQQFGKMYEYKKLTRENVQNIILSLDRVQNEVNEYMLSLDRVMLRTDCIYVDTARDRLVFAYDVGQSEAETEDFRHGIKRLFEFIIEHYDHSQSDSDVIFVYNVYQRIVQGDYDAANLGELVNEKAVAATDDMAAQRSYGEEEGCLDCVAPEIIEDEEEVENKAAAVAVAVMKVRGTYAGACVCSAADIGRRGVRDDYSGCGDFRAAGENSCG
jgi:hypothetical protein